MAQAISDEEDDYMSDAILAKCDDSRPGLLSNQQAHHYKKEAQRKEKQLASRTKPRAQVEQEQRDEALNKSLGTENKGFALLAKMGYKPGTAIGKTGGGRVEPVPVELKAGRTGLGHDTEVRRKRRFHAANRVAMAQKRQKMVENLQNDFLHRHSSLFTEKEAERDLGKSQRVCEQLDSQKGIEEPEEKFFWPASLLPKKNKSSSQELEGDDLLAEPDCEKVEEEEEEEEEEDFLSTLEKLTILTEYLRDSHLYCVWCGTSFNDQEDLQQNCPGDTADDHD